MIILLFVLFLFIWVVAELGTLMTFGSPVSDDELLEAIEKNVEKGVKLSSASSDALYIGKMPCIFRGGATLLYPYHVHNVGTIPFWYKSAKIIKKMFDDNQISSRKKLGLDD